MSTEAWQDAEPRADKLAVTQEARLAAAQHWIDTHLDDPDRAREMADFMLCGQYDNWTSPQAFQRAMTQARADGLDEAGKIAIGHSNYGHVEGNKRAFAIADDLEKRATAIRALPLDGEV